MSEERCGTSGEQRSGTSGEERGGASSDESGSASIWVLTFSALVLLAASLTMTVTALGVGRARAAAAADLAALAAAQHLTDGSACQWAREAARRNAVELSQCRPGSADVTVSVTVPLRLPFWSTAGRASVRATARAGRSNVVAFRHLAVFDSLFCLQPIRRG